MDHCLNKHKQPYRQRAHDFSGCQTNEKGGHQPMKDTNQAGGIVSQRNRKSGVENPFVSVIEWSILSEHGVIERIALAKTLDCAHQISLIKRHGAAENQVVGV